MPRIVTFEEGLVNLYSHIVVIKGLGHDVEWVEGLCWKRLKNYKSTPPFLTKSVSKRSWNFKFNSPFFTAQVLSNRIKTYRDISFPPVILFTEFCDEPFIQQSIISCGLGSYQAIQILSEIVRRRLQLILMNRILVILICTFLRMYYIDRR